ncbi:hypothetical protein [Synechococcus sp. UW105]|uniref:hypothetical protein n=1 Tax=Synechococcus sp. UW105 TaxID=337067 RepID=UPI00148336E8|nr:hypothetical protein [Synechococcus sp. UW105]
MKDERPQTKQQWVKLQLKRFLELIGDMTPMGTASNTIDQFNPQQRRTRDGNWH